MTSQLSAWTGDFGRQFTTRFDQPIVEADDQSRKAIGRSLSDSFRALLGDLPIKKVLEVGCNVGQKLDILSRIGDYDLFGVEPQKEALRIGRARLPDVSLVEGDAFNLPFKDDFFDLVYTSVVLIHIAPADLPRALAEIHRVSKKFIVGMEYHSDKLEEVEYRGHSGLLWKTDFEARYKDLFPDLKTLRSEVFEYDEAVYGRRGLFDKHFLLSK
jgi:pseudaminic acid biosynthesis-associated methylase